MSICRAKENISLFVLDVPGKSAADDQTLNFDNDSNIGNGGSPEVEGSQVL